MPSLTQVPVFPLPDLVVFPNAIVPIHVFELRYRTMVRDALSGGRTIAMGLLKPGWETDYHGSPEFYPLGCLARFEEVHWLPNDCYDLVLRGVARVGFGRIMREYPYRAVQFESLPQEPYSEDDPLVLSEKHALLELYRSLGEPRPEGSPEAGEDLSFESVVNALCMMIESRPVERLGLLRLDSVIERGARVRELAARHAAARGGATEGGERN